MLLGGGRLLVAGNGGSAAQAQHLTAELTGRLRLERRPLPAFPLHADTSSLTAIGNDYGFDEVFARQVRAHGRAGDILLLLTTSGTSDNLRRAAAAARECGMFVWAMTGALPNPIATNCDAVLGVDTTSATTVQECHLVALHLLCDWVETRVAGYPAEVPDQDNNAGVLVVIGDCFLDVDHIGVVRRLAPHAPVPVVEEASTTHRPGGAGLAAVMAAREHDRKVVLVTALGSDTAGYRVRSLLRREGVDVIDLGLGGGTGSKSRVMAGDRMLARFDQPHQVELSDLVGRVDALLDAAQAILVSDYGLGLTAHPPLRDALKPKAGQVPTIWDPHVAGSEPVPGTTVVVPNAVEATALAGLGSQSTGLADALHSGHLLLSRWSVGAIVVTRGAEGAVLLPGPEALPLVVPSNKGADGDTCGAGDRFAASLAKHLGHGAVLSEAVEASTRIAGDYVGRGGLAASSGMTHRTTSRPDSGYYSEQVTGPWGLVVTAGCFDVLHTGHIALMEQARKLGDRLVVCVNSDDSVRRIKGPGRPIVPAHDRVALLQALTCVDDVVIFDEDTPREVLRSLRPDFYVKGGDYTVADLPERPVVESWGGSVMLVPYLAGRSTTGLIGRAGDISHHSAGVPVQPSADLVQEGDSQ